MFLSGCQNNGDIGYLFGTWRIDSFTSDGVDRPEDAKSTLISFQNDIVMVQHILDDEGSYVNYYGTWEETGDVMRINFMHREDYGQVPVPEWLGWTDSEIMDMKVTDRKDGRAMTWTWTAPDGTVNVYRLHKTW